MIIIFYYHYIFITETQNESKDKHNIQNLIKKFEDFVFSLSKIKGINYKFN
jgi:hypothetical protein